MSYKTFKIYQDGEVVVSGDDKSRQTMSRSGFKKFIKSLDNGEYAFAGAPRYHHPGAPDFFFLVVDGDVVIDEDMFDSVLPSRDITDLNDLAEFMIEASTPDDSPYASKPYSDGHPNYWGHLTYL